MKISFLLTAVLLCTLSSLHSEEIVISKIENGAIGFKVPKSENYTMGKVGDLIPVGSWIITDEDSDVWLTFYHEEQGGEENSTLQIGSNTKLKVSGFKVTQEKVETEVNLRAGAIASNVVPRKSIRNDYRVRTRQITASVRGTGHTYQTDAETTDATVTSGTVNMTFGTGESTDVNQGEQTNQNGDSSVDIKLGGAREKTVFSGSDTNEQESQKDNGSPSTGIPSENTESGASNPANAQASESGMKEEAPTDNQDSGNSSDTGSNENTEGSGTVPDDDYPQL